MQRVVMEDGGLLDGVVPAAQLVEHGLVALAHRIIEFALLEVNFH